MLKFKLAIVASVFALQCNAQQLESAKDFPTGYIEPFYFSSNNTIKTIDGVLYMINNNIPVYLLRYPPTNPREEYEIPSTVKRIANNAFQGTKFLKTVKIHNTCTFNNNTYLVIGESAFNDSSIENFEVIENDETSAVNASIPHSVERTEVAKYDITGKPITGSFEGTQIIQYSDGSSVKVLK